MRYLLTLFVLLPYLSFAQKDTIITTREGSQLYSAMSMNGLRTVSLKYPPTSGNRDNFPVGLVLASNRPTFYIWRNTCPSNNEDSVYMHIGSVGCWQRATNNYLTASWCLERVGDDFQIDLQCVLDSLKILMPALDSIAGLRAKIKSDSNYAAVNYAQKTQLDTAFWNSTARQWNARKSSIVYVDSSYSNPAWIASLDVSKVTNAATQSFVTTGIQTLKTYDSISYQPKGNYRTTAQTLTLSGRTLGITDGNQITIPKDTQTISLVSNTLSLSNGGGSVTIPTATTYTGTSPIVVTGSVISYSGLRPVAMPNITVGETAVIAINAGVRNVVVTCAGIIAGERVLVTPTTAPVGYMIGAAVATANNQITVQVSAPLLVIGAAYSISCTVTTFR